VIEVKGLELDDEPDELLELPNELLEEPNELPDVDAAGVELPELEGELPELEPPAAVPVVEVPLPGSTPGPVEEPAGFGESWTSPRCSNLKSSPVIGSL
jgi:hypothetical protein